VPRTAAIVTEMSARLRVSKPVLDQESPKVD